jgi:hypothetical protein
MTDTQPADVNAKYKCLIGEYISGGISDGHIAALMPYEITVEREHINVDGGSVRFDILPLKLTLNVKAADLNEALNGERDNEAAPPPVKPETDAGVKINYEKLKDTFNRICPSLPAINKMTDKRQAKIRALVKGFKGDKKILIEIFEAAEKSDYLTGRDGKWHGCGFDWIINYNNAVKILEGNYDNNRDNKVKPAEKPRKKSKYANTGGEGHKYDYAEIERAALGLEPLEPETEPP